MRVGILALMQESNTFLPATTHWDDFANETLARGSEVRTQFADAPHEIGGFFGGLQTAGLEAVPIFAARAMQLLPSSSHPKVSRVSSSVSGTAPRSW